MDLSLVSIEDLVDEIEQRNDAVVVLMVKNKAFDNSDADFVYRGGAFKCLGMVTKFKNDLLNHIANRI